MQEEMTTGEGVAMKAVTCHGLPTRYTCAVLRACHSGKIVPDHLRLDIRRILTDTIGSFAVTGPPSQCPPQLKADGCPGTIGKEREKFVKQRMNCICQSRCNQIHRSRRLVQTIAPAR
jgi:hypothetical protein